MHFFNLPLDLRLLVYDHVLQDVQAVQQAVQPANTHIRLLRVSRQLYDEAHGSFARYVSLRNEPQIERFHRYIASSPTAALAVRWADVANDGRVVADHTTPASQLHRTLARLPCLERLRVFSPRHYHPVISPTAPDFRPAGPLPRYHLDFEGAMYPSTGVTLPRLISYELYLDPSTRATPFQRLSSDYVRSLRLSGDCHLTAQVSFPALCHLTIRSVTSNTFDRLRFKSAFASSRLESFTYAQGHRLGFEIRNVHIESLVEGPGSRLRKLVLLGCSRLGTSVIASCLRSLPTLEYFALSLITVDELSENFVLALGPCLYTLKLQVAHAWYAVPLFDEERIICNSLEERMLLSNPSIGEIHVCFHSRLMAEDGRDERWKHIAHDRRITLKLGPWEDNEDI